MGVVDQAVEDGVGIGWVADYLVPFVDRNLAGQDGRAAAVSFFEDLVEITAGATVERLEAPIIEDEKLDAVEAAHDAGIAAVAVGQRKIGEELGHALIEDRAVVAAGLVAEGTGKPTFADAGRSSVILPGFRRSRFGSSTRFTRGAARPSRWSAPSAMPVPNIS
jgi:hypothetical protein